MSMKETLLTTLRDSGTSRKEFRDASEQLSLLLAAEASIHVDRKAIEVKTPIQMTTGEVLAGEVMVVPILRAGLAMLSPFLKVFPYASVGFFGMWRDEESKIPHQYYQKIPRILENQTVILIDPMIATGGSGAYALEKLIEKGIPEEKIVYVGIIAAPEGIKRIEKDFPKVKIVVAKVDDHLNEKAFIVPGIGDFGDRYFGTD